MTARWAVYVQTGERRQRLVRSGTEDCRSDAIRAIERWLPAVEPAEAYAYGVVKWPGMERPMTLHRSRGQVTGWRGV